MPPEFLLPDGSPVELSHDDGVAALQAGKVGLPAGRAVNFLAPDGSVVNADAQHTPDLIGAGYRFAGREDLQREADRVQYGEGLGNAAAATLEGAVSGLSLGLYDVGARALAPGYAEGLVKRRDLNPVAAGIGEAGGVVAGALLTGGMAPAALAATAGERAAVGAAKLAATQLGAEALAARAVASSVGRAGVSAAVESAIYGTSKAVADDYLRDHAITAERIAIGAGLGAVTGGIFGAGAAATFAAAARAAAAAQSAASGVGATFGKVRAWKDLVVGGLMGRAGASADDVAAELADRASGSVSQRVGQEVGQTVEQRVGQRIDGAISLTDESAQTLRTVEDLGATLEIGPATADNGVRLGWRPRERDRAWVREQQQADPEWITTLEAVPIDAIDVPPPRDPGRTASVVDGLKSGAEMPPIRLGEAPGGRWTIEDGVHRTNAAREAGATHVPAIVQRRPGEAPHGATQKIDTAKARFAEGATARERFGERQQLAVREIVSAGSENARVFDEAIAFSNVGLKPQAARRAIDSAPPADFAAAGDAMMDTLISTRTALTEIAEGDVREGGKRAARKMLRELDAFEAKALDGLTRGDVDGHAQGLIALDQIKRRVGQVQRIAAQGLDGDKAAQQQMRRLYEDLRGFLENDALHGEGWAKMQRELNAGWAQYLDDADSFEARFSLQGGKATTRSQRDGFDRVYEIDGEKVGPALRNIGSGAAEYDEAARVLVDTPRKQAELMERLAKYYDVDGGHAGMATTMRRNAERIAANVDELRRLQTRGDAFDQAMTALQDMPLVGAQLAKLTISSGRAIDLATRRTATATGSAAAEASASVAAGVTSSTEAVADAAMAIERSRAAAAGVVHRAAVRAADRGERAADSAALALARATRLERAEHATGDALTVLGVEYSWKGRRAVPELRDHLDGVLRDDSDERRKMRGQLAEVRQVSPEMAQALEAHAVKVAAYLRAKAGPSAAERSPGDPWASSREAPARPEEALRLARHADAAVNPGAAVERIRRGAHTREDVAALRELYPAMWGRMRATILAELAGRRERPPAEVLDAVAEVTGVHLGGRSPERVAAWQGLIKRAPAAAALQAQQQGPGGGRRGGRAPRLGSLYEADSVTERADRR